MLSLCFAVPNEDTNLTAVDLSISIHAPLAGCDQDSTFYTAPTGISIHAPLAGCDAVADVINPRKRKNFNPRTPCGVRLGITWTDFFSD